MPRSYMMKTNSSDSIYLARQRRLLDILPHVIQAVYEGQPADRWLANYFRAHPNMGSTDRRHVGEGIFSYFRWKGWLDREQPVDSSMLDLTKGWDHSLPEAPPSGRTWSDLVPKWFTDHLSIPEAEDGPTLQERYIISFQKRPPTWLRRSPATPSDTWETMLRKGLPIQPWPYFSTAARLDKPISRQHLRSQFSTPIEIQDLASQAVGLVAAPKPQETWWDCCAGGGGKALHLADLMEGKGRIVATDPRKSALEELMRRARRHQSNTSIQINVTAAEQYEPVVSFDGIIVDAPCSGMGTWSRNPDARWRTMPHDVDKNAARQAALLDHVVRFLKPGGTLVYSVCTITRAETVDQLERFQAQHADMELEAVSNPLYPMSSVKSKALWIYPWEGPCGAMFIASWRKCAN